MITAQLVFHPPSSQSAVRFANKWSFMISPLQLPESARYWAISVARWTLALNAEDIKRNAKTVDFLEQSGCEGDFPPEIGSGYGR
jgi:hypothetical protein